MGAQKIRVAVFSGLNLKSLTCVCVQCGSSEHPSANRMVMRFALELAGKTYDLPTSSNASRLTIRLVDGCSEDPRCVFSALNCVKLQPGSCEHSSANRITIRFALKLAGKPYDLSASSNASRLTIRLVDVCSEGPRCVFSALNCVKLQRGSSEHSLASLIRFALQFAGKPYDLPANSNANRITKRFADGCSKDPRVFSALYYVKLQRGSFEHPSASRIIIRLTLDFVGKPYDLLASFNANRLTIRFADGCLEGPRCVFSALNYVKSQRGPFKHSSASRMGYLIGNGVTDEVFDEDALVPFAHGMGLISDQLFEELERDCNSSYWNATASACVSKIRKLRQDISALNIYNILEPCYHDTSIQDRIIKAHALPGSFGGLGETRRALPVRRRMFGRAWPLMAPVQAGIVPSWSALGLLDVPCLDFRIANRWLNDPAV
ncbi:hypothetical protein L7F22_061191 [Adiantum nelumboides]|nr:hypothetical protein [Adiantum nelumboides]